MLCSRLSVVRPLLSDREFATFEQYLASLSPNSKLTTAKVSLANGAQGEPRIVVAQHTPGSAVSPLPVLTGHCPGYASDNAPN